METVFLLERKIVALQFNPLKDSVFILASTTNSSENLELTEEDLNKNTLQKRYQLLNINECNIINPSYRHLPNNTYEGYSLYFYEFTKTLIVIYPWAYINIFDYSTTNLLYHFQCGGKKPYEIRNLIGNPYQVITY